MDRITYNNHAINYTRKMLLSIVVFLISIISGYAQNSTSEAYALERIKSEIANMNKALPIKERDGLWIWSVSYSDKVVTFTGKMNSFYELYAQNIMNKMPEEYEKAIVNYFSVLSPLFIKYGISLKAVYRSYDDNSIIKEFLITPQKMSRYCNELQADKAKDIGIRPLSYYQKGFTINNSSLPKEIDEYTILYSISMPKNIVYYNYYLEDILAEAVVEDTTGELKREMKQGIISTLNAFENSDDFYKDCITYNIKFCHRYYYLSNKKLAFEIVINTSTDLK